MKMMKRNKTITKREKKKSRTVTRSKKYIKEDQKMKQK